MQNLISNELICKYVQIHFVFIIKIYIIIISILYLYKKIYVYNKNKNIKKSVYKIQYFKLL